MLHDLVVEGTVVTPERIYEAQIGIDGGYITELKKQGLNGERKIEVRSCLIFPGFIDLHVHLREDSSHQWDYKEDFKSGTAAALHGGITTVVDMPNTPSPGITAERLRRKKELAATHAKGLIDILFCGGVTNSNLNTLAAMQQEVVAYKLYLADTDGLYIDEETVPRAIQAVEATSKPAIIHCEAQKIIDKKREELAAKKEEEKSHVELHSALRPDEAELSAVKSVLSHVSDSQGIKINIAHVSVYDTLGLIKGYKNVHCEVTPHHLFFTLEDVGVKKAFLKTNPPVRTEENRRLLLAALKEGAIDFLATDHAPHTKAEKARGILDAPAGVPQLDTYGGFVSWLIADCGIHPTRIARVCAYNPALFLGLTDRGEIAVGKRAHLTILDMKRPEKISGERLYTKCGWSPFEGYEFPGMVKHTVCNGIVMTDYDQILVDLLT